MIKKKKELEAQALTCDYQPPVNDECNRVNENKIYRHKGACKWRGIRSQRYKKKNGGWSDIVRNVLIGDSGESTKFHLRYFEIAPGGFSSLEKHRHEHVVVCIKGKGRVVMGEKSHVVKNLDTVYISPNTVHQLLNPYDKPFGFFCIVNAKRDKPRLVNR